MRKLLTVLSIAFCGIAVAQRTTTQTFVDKKVGPVYVVYKTVSSESSDPLFMLTLSFRNAAYSQLIEASSFYFIDEKNKAVFVQDLKALLTEIDTKDQINTRIDRENYSLSVNTKEMGKYVSLTAIRNGIDKGYCYISRKQSKELIEILSAITIGK